MAFPGFAALYTLYDPVDSRTYRGEVDRHEAMLGLSRGEAEAGARVQVRWVTGGSSPDEVIWTTSVAPLIVHERVVEVLRSSNFTGWSTFPVEVRDKADRVVPAYHGISVSGRCGPVLLARSALELREFPGGWVPYFRGHYFVPDTWDGSDIFMEAPDELGKVSSKRFVTAAVRAALERAGIRNLEFVSLTDVAVDASVYRVGRQHLLPPDYAARVGALYERAGVPRPKWI